MIMAVVLEMASLASVLPLVATLINVDSNAVSESTMALPTSLSYLSVNLTSNQLLLLIAVIVSLSAVFRILVIRKVAEFSAAIAIDLQSSYFQKTLYSDYEKIINQSSSENISFATNKIQLIIRNYIVSVLRTITAFVSAIGVLAVLSWISNSVILFATLALAAAYLLIASITRLRLKHYGRQLRHDYPRKIQFLREGLGGFRDVMMSGSQNLHVRRFTETATNIENANAKLIFYNDFPKPLIEAFAVCCVVAIAWLVNNAHISDQNLMPLLGAFALGMLRLLPYMQQIFGQWSKFVSGKPILLELMDTMENFTPKDISHNLATSQHLPPFNNLIALTNVTFRYQGASCSALQDINLQIRKGGYIGIVGTTGSGKSTLVDVLMGLLPPTEGNLTIDDITIDNTNRDSWRKQVAHVPQKIFLSQSSIAQNIAFSANAAEIDMHRVKACARLAHIEEYIHSLPRQYATQVGEDGERLSGGQRQRLGIARALYTESHILILDEATNALDAATERSVVQSLLALDQRYTIISVAHNLQAVAHCHRKLLLNAGKASWVDDTRS